MNQASIRTPTRLHGLDALRAFAITAVLMIHYQGLDGLWGHPAWMENPIIQFGWTGVDLFFVLSGYLIASQLLSELETTRGLSLRDFYLKRGFRILPPFLFVLAVYVFFPGARERESLAPLVKYLTFTQNLGLDVAHHKTFSHAWSLCIEEQFYLILPLLLLMAFVRGSLRRLPITVGLLMVAGLLLRYSLLRWIVASFEPEARFAQFMRWIYYPTHARLDGLLVGVLIAWVFQYRPAAREWLVRRPVGCLMAGAGVLATAWAMTRLPARGSALHLSLATSSFPLIAIAYGFWVVAAISPGSFLYRLRSRPVALVATLSYSMYLSHKIVIHLTQGFLRPRGFEMEGMGVFFICMGTCAVAALAMHYALERPSLWMRNRLLARRTSTEDVGPFLAEPASDGRGAS